MPIIEINRNPSPSQLRWFGLLLALFFGIFGGLIWWRFGTPRVAWYLWTAAAIVTLLYYLIPPVRKPLFVGWMYAALPIGVTVSYIILAIVYYLVVTPIGIGLRMAGVDPMVRRLDRSATSYWAPHEPPAETNRYFRQF